MENILSVKLDFIFKLLFGDEKDKDIKRLWMDFLNAETEYGKKQGLAEGFAKGERAGKILVNH